ncbi:MAG: lytic transglycosylase domain-containing protein [Aestuariivirgaceae bacterium]
MQLSARLFVMGMALAVGATSAMADTAGGNSRAKTGAGSFVTTHKAKHGAAVNRKVIKKKRKSGLSLKRSSRRTKYLALARKHKPAGLPISLVDAVITMESGYNPAARGQHGEIGLMQVKPATARMTRSLTGVKGGSLTVPANNLRIGMAYLNWCYKRAKLNVAATIGCYNAGPGNMWKWHKFAVTRKYVRFVRQRVASK